MILFKLKEPVFLVRSCMINSCVGYYFFCPAFKISFTLIKALYAPEYFQKTFINQADDSLLITGKLFTYRIHQGKIMLVKPLLCFSVVGFTVINYIVKFILPQ